MIAKYFYDGLNLIRETSAGNNTEYVFGPSIDEPLALYASGAVSYLNADGLGSVVATNGPTGTVTHSSIFDAWGVARNETGTRAHSFTYTGREVGEAGTLAYRARLLDPARGRFTAEDPALADGPGGFVYGYAVGNPIGWYDPLGLASVSTNKDGSSTIVVGKCEVAFIHGHGDFRWPHTVRFKSECSAASFIGCGSKSTNQRIPQEQRIPGAPNWTSDIEGIGPNRDPEYDESFDAMLAGAKKRAAELCDCCEEVTIVFPYTKGGNFFEDTFQAPSYKPIKVKCQPKKKR